MEICIKTLGATKVARVRHIGPYNEVGPSFERLFAWAVAIGARPGRVISISYDNPESVAPESLRSDACLELETDASPPPGISMDSIGAGRWAVYTHRGPYDGIADAYRRMFGSWLPGSGEEIDDRPCMECYHNSAARNRTRGPADRPVPALATDILGGADFRVTSEYRTRVLLSFHLRVAPARSRE